MGKTTSVERLPRQTVYRHTLNKTQEPRQEVIEKIIARTELLMEKSPTQPDLFDDEPVRTPSPIVAIENAIKEYRALLMLTAADYTYIMKNFDIPTEVTQSYIAYLRNLILIGDSVGTVKLYLDLWVKQSIALGKMRNKTFHQALDIGYQTGKYGNTSLKDFFQKNRMYYDSVLKSMIPYLVYKHTGQLPVGKIVKDMKS